MPEPSTIVPPTVRTCTPRIRPGKVGSLQQLLAIQQLLYMDAIDPSTTKEQRCRIASAWTTLEERKRIIRMKPKPGAVRVSTKRPARTSSGTGPSPEPVEPTGTP